MIVRYEREARLLLAQQGRAQEVRCLRVGNGLTWRAVAEECQERWGIDIGRGDTQSFGATICHVAAQALGQDPDAEPWN